MTNSVSRLRSLTIIAAVAVCVGCGGGAATLTTEAPASTEPVTPDYTIGPGDTLGIFVWRNPDLGGTNVPVRPDGKISIPLVEDMVAVDKTTSQLATDIEAVLGQFVRTPDVTVSINSFGIGAFDNQIRIVGAGAANPQAIPYRQGLTLLDIMIAVGLAEFAAGDRAKLVRRVNGELQEMPIRLNRLINRGDLSENVALLPGDVLIIPEARF